MILHHKFNSPELSSMMSSVVKVLIGDDPIKLFLDHYLAKFLDMLVVLCVFLANPFYPT